MKGNPFYGYTVGNGAALNIELGFVPHKVSLWNLTDGDVVTHGFLQWVVPFTSGGTFELAPGHKIIGATSGATAVIESVLLYSGTWAAGDAAGFFVLVEGTKVGTFSSENVYTDSSSSSSGTNDATVTANVVYSVAISTAAATVTTTSAISRYEGVAGTNSAGFTIGSAIAEEAKVLFYEAYRSA